MAGPLKNTFYAAPLRQCFYLFCVSLFVIRSYGQFAYYSIKIAVTIDILLYVKEVLPQFI